MGAIAYAVDQDSIDRLVTRTNGMVSSARWCKPRRVFGKFSRVRGNVGLRRRYACIAAVAY